jgi:ABC-type branched-subunit amino acid transport system substrate-binding protein
MTARKQGYSICLALSLLGISSAFAETQAPARAPTSGDIVIGHVAGYTGPTAKEANELKAGATAYFESVNEHGGIDGRKLRLVTFDDQFKAENTVKLMTEVKGKAIALLPMIGSANGAAVIKENVLEIPVVGTIPSPDIMRNPMNKNIFHIRASDKEQTERILEQLVTVGLTNIALMVPNNPFGDQATKQAEAYLATQNHKLAVNAVYTLVGPKPDFQPALKTLEGKSYHAVVMYGPPPVVAAMIKEMRSRGETAQLYALSYADSKLVTDVAGTQLAHGVVISQVMPNLNTKTMPLIKEFRENFAKYGNSKNEPNPVTLEGYVSARLIVEAIRRSKDASPEGVRRGLEQLRGYDLGGYIVDFSPAKHQGSSFVDLSLIGGTGKLVY